MTENEVKLIEMIRNSKDPDRALQLATEIILDYLAQRESSQSQSVAPLPESYAVT
jgi:hypothetical protein